VHPAILALDAALAAAAAIGGVQTYSHFAGEHPILDPLYERQLRRSDRAALANAAATRPRSDVIVTLTTLPSRIGRIETTIKSLLNQRLTAKAIRIHVPAFSRREQRRYEVPAWLRGIPPVEIVECDDYGPATKITPALQGCAPDQRLLVVDDDRIYHPWLVEQLIAASEAYPNIVVAGSGWNAPEDLVDRPTTLSATIRGLAPAPIKCTRVRGRRDVDIVQGLSGYLVQPSFFDVRAIADYSAAPAAAFFVDDVWISAHCRVPKAVVQGRRTNFASRRDARFYKRSSVALVNRGDGSLDSRNNTIMLKYFGDRWRSGRVQTRKM
jgi:hypothetical protein